MTSTVIATRGERLVLSRVRLSGRDQRPEAFHTEVLGIVEIDADERIVASRHVRPRRHRRRLRGTRCPLPRRRSGRPRAHMVGHRSGLTPRSTGTNSRATRTTSPSTTGRSLINRGEFSRIHPRRLGPHARPQHPHRGGASAERFRSRRHPYGVWDLARRLRRRVANDRLLTVEGDRINRCEIFDETDLDTALARFEELQPQARRLENAASQVAERFWTLLRGPRLGRDGRDNGRRLLHTRSPSGCQRRMSCAVEMPMSRTCEQWPRSDSTDITSTVISDPRGAPCPHSHSFLGARLDTGEVTAEMLSVVEIDTDNRLAAPSSSTPTTSTPRSKNSTRGTSPAKRPPTRTRGRSSRGLYAAFNRHELPDDGGLGQHRPPAARPGRRE